jgi:hypothetical protein
MTPDFEFSFPLSKRQSTHFTKQNRWSNTAVSNSQVQCLVYETVKALASADFSPGVGQNFPGGPWKRIYFLPKKTTKRYYFSQKGLKHNIFGRPWSGGGQEPPCPLRTSMCKNIQTNNIATNTPRLNGFVQHLTKPNKQA